MTRVPRDIARRNSCWCSTEWLRTRLASTVTVVAQKCFFFHGYSTFPWIIQHFSIFHGFNGGFFQWVFRLQLIGKFLSGWCSDGVVANTTQWPNRGLGMYYHVTSQLVPLINGVYCSTQFVSYPCNQTCEKHRHLWRNKSQHQTKNRCTDMDRYGIWPTKRPDTSHTKPL